MNSAVKDPTTTPSYGTLDDALPLGEIVDFYSVSHRKPPQPPICRPYIWCNSLVTLDGYLSFHEPGDFGVEGVGMKKWYPKLLSVDFRLLHAGWALSDAILITASELRNEPKAQIRVLFDDLVQYRITHLNKPAQPYLVILTRSGNIPADHPVFHPPQKDRSPILVITTTRGFDTVPHAELAHTPNPPKVMVMDDNHGGVCFNQLFAFLYTDCNVLHLDCGTGGDVIQQLLVAKYIDEMRMTLAGQIAGGWSNALTRRPHFFPTDRPRSYFTADTAPHLDFDRIRTVGKQFLFLRMSVTYRH